MQKIVELLELIRLFSERNSRSDPNYAEQVISEGNDAEAAIKTVGGAVVELSPMLAAFYSYANGWSGADRLMRWFSIEESCAAIEDEHLRGWLTEDIENEFAPPAGVSLDKVAFFGTELDGGDFRIYLVFSDNVTEPIVVKYGHEIQIFDDLTSYLVRVVSVNAQTFLQQDQNGAQTTIC